MNVQPVKMLKVMMSAVVTLCAGTAVALPPPLPRAPLQPQAEPELKLVDSRMVFETKAHNFGDIFDHEEQKFEFKFTNRGSVPLIIGSITSTCGCTVPDVVKKVYEPGESGEITVMYNPSGKKGVDARSVTIATNDMVEPQARLNIQANVKPLIVIEPTFIQFGQANKGEVKEADLYVGGRIDDFKVSIATTSMPEAFEVVVGDTEVRKIGNEELPTTKITVRMKPNAPIGVHRAEMSIRTSDPRRPIVHSQVLAHVLGDLALIPPRLSLGRVDAGSTYTREFRVQSRSGAPFKINEVVVRDSQSKATFEFEPDDVKNPTTWRVRMTGFVGADERRILGSILVRTDVRDEEAIDVQFNGFVNPR
ncbi:MAG: DUF1573 domain-containing protein [Phycisphaeraceae bacterium]|nr:DUF1573 domain-containing protein [Phycisphaeraceae bacterium]MCW5763192.1 DUF1573 domain-containing protein [Phycisphaeraceae bacterium]